MSAASARPDARRAGSGRRRTALPSTATSATSDHGGCLPAAPGGRRRATACGHRCSDQPHGDSTGCHGHLGRRRRDHHRNLDIDIDIDLRLSRRDGNRRRRGHDCVRRDDADLVTAHGGRNLGQLFDLPARYPVLHRGASPGADDCAQNEPPQAVHPPSAEHGRWQFNSWARRCAEAADDRRPNPAWWWPVARQSGTGCEMDAHGRTENIAARPGQARDIVLLT
jgi:hypothetical protein